MKRKDEISFLNVLFCLLVIFIHIASEPVSSLDKQSPAYAVMLIMWRISAFVVQGFIFLAGMKQFLSSNKTKYVNYCIGRGKKVVIPYVFAVCLFYAYFILKGGYFEFSLVDLGGYILNGMLVSHFYFVVVIVQFYLLRPLWNVIVKRISPLIGILSALVITLVCGKYLPSIILMLGGKEFNYNDRILTTYIIYWIMGCYAGNAYEKFGKFSEENFKKITAAFLPIAVAEAVLVYLQFTGRVQLAFLEQLHLVYCCGAILFFFAAAKKIGRRFMENSLMRRINVVSYYIYLIHPLVIFVLNDFMTILGVKGILWRFALRASGTYAITTVICILYVGTKEGFRKRVKSLLDK